MWSTYCKFKKYSSVKINLWERMTYVYVILELQTERLSGRLEWWIKIEHKDSPRTPGWLHHRNPAFHSEGSTSPLFWPSSQQAGEKTESCLQKAVLLRLHQESRSLEPAATSSSLNLCSPAWQFPWHMCPLAWLPPPAPADSRFLGNRIPIWVIAASSRIPQALKLQSFDTLFKEWLKD